MLILVHCLTLLIFHLIKHRKRMKYLQSIENNIKMVEHQATVPKIESDLEYNLKFDPPVYRQRYEKVYETLIDERWRKQITKLCDFGCSEFGLFMFIKQLSRLNDIYFVDIDEDTLRDNLRRIYPLTIEYLKRREEPLEVNVFAGSVADADYRLSNTDAVVAIELIEHLYPDTLDAFPYNIFGFIEPKIVIITTPNADFNVVFSSDPKRMRHYDHKFEWSREQFSQWATNVVSRFPDYMVTLCGIGRGPDGTEHLGECSQMALFVRRDVLHDSYVSRGSSFPCNCNGRKTTECNFGRNSMECNCVCPLCSPSSSFGVCTYFSCSKQIIDYEIEDNSQQDPSHGIFYKFIEKIEFPFERDERSEEEKMMDEFRYRINSFGHVNGRFYVEERNRSEIPLLHLNYGADSWSIAESELCKLLAKHGYKVEVCLIEETDQFMNCVVHEPDIGSESEDSEPSDDSVLCSSIANSLSPSEWHEDLSDWD